MFLSSSKISYKPDIGSSTQNSKTFEIWYENFLENPKFVEFSKCEPLDRECRKFESGKNILEHFAKPREVLFPFPEISENDVPFDIGNFRKVKLK